MKKVKTLVDREPLGSDYIASKQNFESICTQVQQLTPTWKTPWFYGPVGLATLAVCISLVTVQSSSATEKPTPQAQVLPKSDVPQKPEIIEEDKILLVENADKVESPPIEKSVSTQAEVAKKEQVTLEKEVAEDINTQSKEREANIENKAQVITKRTVPKDNRFPHIAGYFTGEVPVEALFDADGIQLREGYTIISFDLNFYNGKSNVVESYRGNVIPSELKTIIRNYNVGNMVFITNIKAIDEMDRIFVLPAINYKLIH